MAGDPIPHATDDLGFPLRPSCCPACRALSKHMNEEYLQRIFAWDVTPSDFERLDDWSKP